MREALWIDGTAGLEAALGSLEDGPVGLDLEADSFHHFQAKICLIQLSAPNLDLLIDPLAGVDLSLLAPLFTDTTRRKVLHGGDYDVRMLRGGRGLRLEGLFDTMIAARLTGEGAVGLAALLEKHLGVRLDKRFQRADWSVRPLPAALRDYATLDTRHLVELAGLLSRRLEQLGRTDWAEEEFERLSRLEPATPEAEPWRRVKGAALLSARELAGLRELSEMRDELARARDVPRFRIVQDEVLVDAARVLVRAGGAPDQVPRLSEAWSRGALRSRWDEAARRVRALPPEEWPEAFERGRPRRDPVREAGLRRLAVKRDRLATELALEASLVASRGQLEEVLDALESGSGLEGAPSLRRWQRALLAPLFEG